MNACSARRLRAGTALAAAVAAGRASQQPALGQARTPGAPVSLAPPRSLAPQPEPAEQAAPQPGTAPAGAAAATDAGTGIRVDTLRDIDPSSVGLLDAASGGFGIAMWQGTSRTLVERLLPRLQAAPQSTTARTLFRRLLLSAAVPPAGPGTKDGPGLLALRVGRLLDQGDVASAQALLRLAPARADDEAIARARADVAFLMNDNAGACTEARARLGQSPDTFWQKAQVFCQLLDGDRAGANIGTGLLQEQGVQDPAFFALVRMLSGETGIVADGMDRPLPIHLAMMRAAKVQIPAAVTAQGAPQVLRTVALSPNADIETRLEAAERAEARGALETESLRQLYLSVNVPPDELAGAISAAEKLSPARGRAVLYRAIRSQTVPAAQAEILARVFALARAQDRLLTAVRVFLPAVQGMEPAAELAWFASDAAAALYLGGAYEAADKWYQLARSNPAAARPVAGSGDAKTIPADMALWPLAAVAALPRAPQKKAMESAAATTVISGASVTVVPVATADPAADGFDEATFDRWWKAAAVLGDEARLERAARFLSVLEALGAQIGDDAWARLVTAPTESRNLPPVALVASLRRAAMAGRVGETVLTALTTLGAEPPGKADPRRIAPVVKALADVGLADDARALSIEAVFGSGV